MLKQDISWVPNTTADEPNDGRNPRTNRMKRGKTARILQPCLDKRTTHPATHLIIETGSRASLNMLFSFLATRFCRRDLQCSCYIHSWTRCLRLPANVSCVPTSTFWSILHYASLSLKTTFNNLDHNVLLLCLFASYGFIVSFLCSNLTGACFCEQPCPWGQTSRRLLQPTSYTKCFMLGPIEDPRIPYELEIEYTGLYWCERHRKMLSGHRDMVDLFSAPG